MALTWRPWHVIILWCWGSILLSSSSDISCLTVAQPFEEAWGCAVARGATIEGVVVAASKLGKMGGLSTLRSKRGRDP